MKKFNSVHYEFLKFGTFKWLFIKTNNHLKVSVQENLAVRMNNYIYPSLQINLRNLCTYKVPNNITVHQ